VLYGTVHERRILEDSYKAIVRTTLNLVSVESGEVVWSYEVTQSANLEWADIIRVATTDVRVWVILGIIIVIIIWRAFKGLVKSATRPR
jgi:hypothetical protein